jgi:hypothetical protein
VCADCGSTNSAARSKSESKASCAQRWWFVYPAADGATPGAAAPSPLFRCSRCDKKKKKDDALAAFRAKCASAAAAMFDAEEATKLIAALPQLLRRRSLRTRSRSGEPFLRVPSEPAEDLKEIKDKDDIHEAAPC